MESYKGPMPTKMTASKASEGETPRVDALNDGYIKRPHDYLGTMEIWKLARTLERELAAAEAKVLRYELCMNTGGIDDLYAKLSAAELDAGRLREQFQSMVDFDLKQCAADFGKDDVDHQFRLWAQNRALAALRRSAP